MRKAHDVTLENVKIRVFGSHKDGDLYINEIATLLSSTCGPVVIASFIEKGLSIHKKIKCKKRKNSAKDLK